MESEEHNYSNAQPGIQPNINDAGPVLVADLISMNQEPPPEGLPRVRVARVQAVEIEHEPEVEVVDNVDEAMDVDHRESEQRRRFQEQVEAETPSSGIRRSADDSEDMDPGSLCNICFSNYDTGVHKLSCLKCGHLFGLSCLEHWLKVGCTHQNRRCPTCNTKASLKDVRVLYAKTLVATDTSEIDRLVKKIEKIQNEKGALESLSKNYKLQTDLKIEMLQQQITKYEETIRRLTERVGPKELAELDQKSYAFISNLVSSIKLSEQGECRVLAHSNHLSLLLATQSSTNPTLFPGYGIRKINTHDMKPVTYLKLHDKSIRDIAFGCHERSNLLSVSLDCTAKLFDVQSNAVVQTFKVSEPLWAGCWGTSDAYKIYCGSQTGSFYVFDRRQSRGEPERVVKVPGQKTGLISLSSVPPRPGRFMPNGGILACSLTSILAFYPSGNDYESKVLPIEGNFLSMRYNEPLDNILISAKSSTTWKAPRHLVCQLSHHGGGAQNEIDILHTYYATRNPSVLSKSIFVPTPNGDQLICAYNDRDKTLDAWSMVSDKKLNIRDVNLPDPVLDLCSFNSGENEITVPCLSAKNLNVVKFKLKSQY